MYIRPDAFPDELDSKTKKSVSTEISQEMKDKLGLSEEEVQVVLSEDLNKLEDYTFIDRV